MHSGPKTRGPLSVRALIALAVGLAVAAGVVKFAVVTLLVHLQTNGIYLRLQDSILTGILAGIAVSAVILIARERRKYLVKQAETVATLNHELRNALEVILANEYLVKSDKSQAILESVERINRTLDNILGPQQQRRRF